MELLGDEAQVESRFGLFGYSVSICARSVHGLCQTYHRLRNCFGLFGQGVSVGVG